MAADESRYRRMTPRITSLACPLERPYSLRTVKGDGKGRGMIDTLTHLDRLEAESIHIMREVMADAAKPVMLYSVGKDSAVMLHLESGRAHACTPVTNAHLVCRLLPEKK